MSNSNDSTKNTRGGRSRTGTLELRKTGWWARLTITVEGAAARRWFRLGTFDRSAATRKAASLARRNGDQVEVDVAELEAEAKRIETYEEAAQRVRERRKADGYRAVSSEQICDTRYLNPKIGKWRVTDVRKQHIKAILEAAMADGKSRETLAHVRSAASIVFRVLEEEGAIPAGSNPAREVSIPRAAKRDRRERVVLTDEELGQYLGWEHPDPRLQVAVLERQTMSILSGTFGGLRTGDLHALRWDALETDGGRFEFGWAPRQKTERPQKLVIAEMLRPFVRRWWEHTGCPASGFVFPRLVGDDVGVAGKGKTSHAKALRRDLARALGLQRWEAGRWVDVEPEAWSARHRELLLATDRTRPVDFHSWRRFFNQKLAEAGVNAQEAAALSGHANLTAHMRYLTNTARARTVPEAALPKLTMVPAGANRPAFRTIAPSGFHETARRMVEDRGLEPLTSGLQSRRSPS